MLVLLFDIDGTLIHTSGAGGAALMGAFCEEFGVEDPQPVPFSGRTDRGIVRSLFLLHDVSDSPSNWRRLRDAYVEKLPACLASRDGRILAGVSELLSTLHQRSDVLLGLLTGNLREGARIKLNHFGLFEAFSFGGFGDDHHDRDDVARTAQAEAKARLNDQVRQTWVIGDTPLDVSCGRAIEARTLAVATGIHDRSELAASRPDLLLDDLSDTEGILQSLL